MHVLFISSTTWGCSGGLCHVGLHSWKIITPEQKACCALQFVKVVWCSGPSSSNWKEAPIWQEYLALAWTVPATGVFAKARIWDVRVCQRKWRVLERCLCEVHRNSFGVPVRNYKCCLLHCGRFCVRDWICGHTICNCCVWNGWMKFSCNFALDAPVYRTCFSSSGLQSPPTSPCMKIISAHILWGCVKVLVCLPPIPMNMHEFKCQIVSAAESIIPDMPNSMWQQVQLVARCLPCHKGSSQWALVMTVAQTCGIPLSFCTQLLLVCHRQVKLNNFQTLTILCEHCIMLFLYIYWTVTSEVLALASS